MEADSPLSVRSVSSGYFGKEVLHGVSFEVNEPGIYVVLGLNGAGKATLFRTIAGILRPMTGGVCVFGQPVTERETKRKICHLSHSDALPEGMTVSQALAFYSRIEGASEEDVKRTVESLSLSDLMGKRV
ncbi:MAG: ATP-binding cassette domain-containing protein, partial [TACK group archaeon]|nr:ATP-binding cassette domain-containing protein [TACK group archaeon]